MYRYKKAIHVKRVKQWKTVTYKCSATAKSKKLLRDYSSRFVSNQQRLFLFPVNKLDGLSTSNANTFKTSRLRLLNDDGDEDMAMMVRAFVLFGMHDMSCLQGVVKDIWTTSSFYPLKTFLREVQDGMKKHAKGSKVAEVPESEVVFLLGHRVNMDRRTFQDFIAGFTSTYQLDAVDRDGDWACMYLTDV